MRSRPASVVCVVRGGAQEARALVEEFFTSRGWTPRVQVDGTIAYEHGSRRRTILLGALAGKKFFLTAVTEVRKGDEVAEIHYRWGPGAGLALGGSVGRKRAERAHAQLAVELEAQLERSGRLLQVRRR